jgi:hypothetical protein
MHTFAVWLKGTHVSWLITHYAWVWAISQVVHFFGMSLLFGCIALLDLRILGIGISSPVSAVNQFVPWGICGFIMNVITGSLFFLGQPLQYVDNPGFWLKMLFIFLAGGNIAIFYLTGIADRVEVLEAGDEAPLAAKVIAGSSLVLWVGVMFFGRMLPYFGAAF